MAGQTLLIFFSWGATRDYKLFTHFVYASSEDAYILLLYRFYDKNYPHLFFILHSTLPTTFLPLASLLTVFSVFLYTIFYFFAQDAIFSIKNRSE